MKILAVDTSSKTAYAALVTDTKDGRLVPSAQYSFTADSHTVALAKMTDSVLNLTGISFDDIDFYAAAVGPGSFTGIRIGVSAVKGYAFVDSKPCVGVSSLEALASALTGICGIITPLIDARRETYYTAAFLSDGNGEIRRLTDDAQLEKEEYFNMIQKIRAEYPDEKVILTGDGAESIKKTAPEYGFWPDSISANAAYGAAAAAYKIWNSASDRSIFTDVNLQPVYLKKSQAERERDERIAAEKSNAHGV